MTVTAEQAKAMLDAATGERWHWAGDIKTRGPELSTWIPGQGRTTVVAAQRLGMRGAQLTFNVDGLLTASATLAIREAPYRDDVKDIDHPDARLIAAAPDLAATVVELYERLATVAAKRIALARWKAEAMTVLKGWDQVWHAAGRPGALGESTSVATAKHIAALQAAIDKVLALHLSHDDICEHCGWGYWPCPTVQALTQGGEGL